MHIGGIEAGGTKINCAIGTREGKILEQIQFPTAEPEVTTQKMLEYFRDKNISALGVASFGPIDLNPHSDSYGSILETPKQGWAHFNLIQELKKEINVPISFDTDVNGAAKAEHLWGAAKGLSSCIYLTIGTGVGGGAYIDGKLVHGLLHPEMGHILVRRHPEDNYIGTCPFHHDCLEGLAAGPSVLNRLGISGQDIPDNHPVWNYISYYLAQAILNYSMILSPEVILLGGGVMKQQHLFSKIRLDFKKLLGGYIQHGPLPNRLEEYIRFPALGDFAGLYGSLALTID